MHISPRGWSGLLVGTLLASAAAAAVVRAWAPAGRRAPSAVADPGAPDAGEAAAAALFDPRPGDPFDRAFDLLYRASVTAGAPACAVRGGCAKVAEVLGETIPWTVEEPEDVPASLLRGDPAALCDEPRAYAVHRALAAVDAAAASRTTLARALLQSDLWERHDALLVRAAREPDPLRAERCRALTADLARAIRSLAPRAQDVRALASNLPAVVRAAGPTLAGLDTGEGWRELGPCAGSGTPVGFLHARSAGFRAVVRVLVSAPGSDLDGRLVSPPRTMPVGTRLALTIAPLVITAEGGLEPLPLVTSIEARVVRTDVDPARLDALGFEADEARRALLVAGDPSGGLRRVPDGALVPASVSLDLPILGWRPMPGVCVQCHGAAADSLLTASAEAGLCAGPPSPGPQTAWTVQRKLASPELAALLSPAGR